MSKVRIINGKEYITTTDAAAIMGFHKAYVRKLARENPDKVHAVKYFCRWYYEKVPLLALCGVEQLEQIEQPQLDL